MTKAFEKKNQTCEKQTFEKFRRSELFWLKFHSTFESSYGKKKGRLLNDISSTEITPLDYKRQQRNAVFCSLSLYLLWEMTVNGTSENTLLEALVTQDRKSFVAEDCDTLSPCCGQNCGSAAINEGVKGGGGAKVVR